MEGRAQRQGTLRAWRAGAHHHRPYPGVSVIHIIANVRELDAVAQGLIEPIRRQKACPSHRPVAREPRQEATPASDTRQWVRNDHRGHQWQGQGGHLRSPVTYRGPHFGVSRFSECYWRPLDDKGRPDQRTLVAQGLAESPAAGDSTPGGRVPPRRYALCVTGGDLRLAQRRALKDAGHLDHECAADAGLAHGYDCDRALYQRSRIHVCVGPRNPVA